MRGEEEGKGEGGERREREKRFSNLSRWITLIKSLAPTFARNQRYSLAKRTRRKQYEVQAHLNAICISLISYHPQIFFVHLDRDCALFPVTYISPFPPFSISLSVEIEKTIAEKITCINKTRKEERILSFV